MPTRQCYLDVVDHAVCISEDAAPHYHEAAATAAAAAVPPSSPPPSSSLASCLPPPLRGPSPATPYNLRDQCDQCRTDHHLCVMVHTVCVGEDAAPCDHEATAAAAAAVLPAPPPPNKTMRPMLSKATTRCCCCCWCRYPPPPPPALSTTDLCVVVHAMCVGEDAASCDHEAAAAAAVLPLALPRQAIVGLSVYADHLPGCAGGGQEGTMRGWSKGCWSQGG
jgi:hypothetical protein